MRKELFVGLALAAATLLLVLGGNWLDLELTGTALLGVTVGAVVGLVPDRSALARVIGFAAGLGIAWVGYIVRTSALPLTETGSAVAYTLMVLVALGVVLAARGWLPFWSPLLGIGAFAGAYEAAYQVAKPLVMDTSVTAATSLLLTAAVGFLAVSWLAPEHEAQTTVVRDDEGAETPTTRTRTDDDTVALDSMMGSNR
jgi:hypothetical protein